MSSVNFVKALLVYEHYIPVFVDMNEMYLSSTDVRVITTEIYDGWKFENGGMQGVC